MEDRKIYKILIISVVLFLGATLSYSQSKYIDICTSPGISQFRDLATSPLYYKGNTISLSGGYLKLSKERLSGINIEYTTGGHKSNYNGTNESSLFHSIDVSYKLLFPVKIKIGEKTSLYAGGSLVTTTNFRENKALHNNSFGLENITNLMLASLIEKGTNSGHNRGSKFFVELLAGIANMNYRPGYAYSYMPAINETTIRALAGYNFSLSGFRFKAKAGYRKKLPNGNMMALFYNFDVYNAPGKYEPFNYSRHSVSLSLIFKYK